jgi:dihydrofolate reductase
MADELVLVLARAKNGVIGKNGGLPWHLPEDLKHFRRVTTGHAIIMGRKTYESIGRPLPQRRSLVVTRMRDRVIEGCEVCASLDEAIARARETDPEPRVIGGAEIYLQALPRATTIFLTEVDRDVEGDATMPAFDPSDWEETERVRGETDSVSFVTLRRRVIP